MRTGTKSVLFGAHQFVLHPLFVALAWWKLYGFPWDPRLWVAFIVHDLGYWGSPNMDGPEGERHVELGGRVMRVFDKAEFIDTDTGYGPLRVPGHWELFCLYHSRFMAKRDDMPFSRLCVADKLSICLEPAWLYLPRVIASGEIKEYLVLAGKRKYDGEPVNKYESMNLASGTIRDWHRTMVSYLRRWVDEHRDGREDTWTPKTRQAIDESGVWK